MSSTPKLRAEALGKSRNQLSIEGRKKRETEKTRRNLVTGNGQPGNWQKIAKARAREQVLNVRAHTTAAIAHLQSSGDSSVHASKTYISSLRSVTQTVNIKKTKSVESVSCPTSGSTISTCSGGFYTFGGHHSVAPGGSAKLKLGQPSQGEAAEIAWLEDKHTQEENLLKEEEQLKAEFARRIEKHDEDYARSMANFDAHWDQFLMEFQTSQTDMLNTFKANQVDLHKNYIAEIEREMEPRQPKWSAECLNLLKMEQALIKQGRFVEAQLRKQKADKLKESERAAWKRNRDKKKTGLEEKFVDRQRIALARFTEKQTTEKQKIIQQQALERRNLCLQYSNTVQKGNNMKRIALGRYEKKVAVAAFTRHGQALHPDFSAEARPNWKGTRIDAPYVDSVSPEFDCVWMNASSLGGRERSY